MSSTTPEPDVTEIKWSAHNFSRMLRLTGERPARVQELRAILGALGLGSRAPWLQHGGIFDHGRFYARKGQPFRLCGYPYYISNEERALLCELTRFPTLRVEIDQRPSAYGHGTHDVRIELAEVHTPFDPGPSTYRTRAAARAARKAFREAGLPNISKPDDGIS